MGVRHTWFQVSHCLTAKIAYEIQLCRTWPRYWAIRAAPRLFTDVVSATRPIPAAIVSYISIFHLHVADPPFRSPSVHSSTKSINLLDHSDTLPHEGLHELPVEDQDESCSYTLSFHPVSWPPHRSAPLLTHSWDDHALLHSTLGLQHVKVSLLIANSTILNTITGISHGPSSLYVLYALKQRRVMTDRLPHSSPPALS